MSSNMLTHCHQLKVELHGWPSVDTFVLILYHINAIPVFFHLMVNGIGEKCLEGMLAKIF